MGGGGAMSEKHVRIIIEKMPSSSQWGWECTVDGSTWYGYEQDYLNAESQMREKLRELGVDDD